MKTYFNLSLILALSLGVGMTLLLSSVMGPQGGDVAERSHSAPPPATPGQSATLLPDGRWLLVGGEGPAGPLATATTWDPHTETTTPVSQPLQSPRAWHSATVLPDGSVFIFGGIGPKGQVVDGAEVFEPDTQTFATLPATGLTPRAFHTATLLTEGRVLLAGGVSNTGETLAIAELWDPYTPPSALRIR